MQAILALDMGGSKSDAVLLDMNGTILGWGHSSRPGHSGRDLHAAKKAVHEAVEQHNGFDALHLVANGSVLPLDVFRYIKTGRFEVSYCMEAEAAYAHAGVDHGVVLLSGTGAFAHGEDPTTGRHAHLDGTGPILGDFGGGYHIGMMAVHAIVRSTWHPRHETRLSKRLLDRFGVRHPLGLIRLQLFSQDRSLIASIAKDVTEEADAGDPVAKEITRLAATSLSETFRDLVTGMEMVGKAYTVVGTGGIIRRCNLYWDTLCERVAQIDNSCVMHRLLEPAVVGLAIHGLSRLPDLDRSAAIGRLKTQTAAYRDQYEGMASHEHPPTLSRSGPNRHRPPRNIPI